MLSILFIVLSSTFQFSLILGYVAAIIGALLTVVIQSSSIFTSTLTPLVGIGVLELETIFPLTLGSNLGTTGTGILAAFANENLNVSLQIALCHLLFNLSGFILWYPVPLLRKVKTGFKLFIFLKFFLMCLSLFRMQCVIIIILTK